MDVRDVHGVIPHGVVLVVFGLAFCLCDTLVVNLVLLTEPSSALASVLSVQF